MPMPTNRIFRKWRPLADLPAEWLAWRPAFGPGEWDTEYANRLWAIETGRVELLYRLDDAFVELLATEGFGPLPDGPAKALILDQHEVIEALCQYAAEGKGLSTSFTKEIQAALTAHQLTAKGLTVKGLVQEVTLLRGAWKVLPNNPMRPDGLVHEYCPPEQVAPEMERLLALHRAHAAAGVHPLVESAWLHNRFVATHPFQDGNGRTARALSTLILLEGGWPTLTVRFGDRLEYFGALDDADNGDLGPLVEFFAKCLGAKQ